MGIFSRIGDVVKSNINDLIDRAEDPEKMVKQIILDLQKEVSNATTALGKAKASERIAKRQYQQMYEQIAAQTAQLQEQVETLKSKLDEAKSRQAMLIARSQMAKTQKNLAQSVGGLDSSSAMDKFNRMEEKVTRQEAEAEAFAEIAGSSSTQDEKTFAELQHDMDVDAELQRLMAEMGQTDAASATEGSAAE